MFQATARGDAKVKTSDCRVAIVGAGPSGLALAGELARGGIDDVVLLEREANAGGIPRHCGHSPFGLREFHRILSGSEYARRLAERAQRQGARLWTAATVTEVGPGRNLTLSTASVKRRAPPDWYRALDRSVSSPRARCSRWCI